MSDRFDARTSRLKSKTPKCPRCHYDQTGEIARWRDQCPMFGRCVECGLEIDWRDVFVRPRCDGLVEHARGLRQWALWGLRTSLAILWPHRFWSRVDPRHELKLFRALLWFALPLSLSLAPALGRALYTFVAECIHYWEMSGPEWAIKYAFSRSYEIVLVALPWMTWWFYPYIAMALTTPVLLLWLRRMRFEDDLSTAQIARCAFYALALGFGVWQFNEWYYKLVFALEDFVVSWMPAAERYVEVISLWHLHQVPVPLFLGVWLLCWNWFALTEGLRVRTPFRVWAVLSAATLVVGLGVVLCQEKRWSDAVYWWMGW